MDTFAQWKNLSNHGYRSRVHIFGIVLFLLKFLFLKISTNFIYSYSKIREERKVIYAWTYNVRFVYHFERGIRYWIWCFVSLFHFYMLQSWEFDLTQGGTIVCNTKKDVQRQRYTRSRSRETGVGTTQC